MSDGEPQKFPFSSVIYVDDHGALLERQHVSTGPVPCVGDHVCFSDRERPWVVDERRFDVHLGSVTIKLTRR